MHATLAANATLARVVREAPSVSAMNEGTTASGLTIVINAVNERRATFHSGTGREVYRVPRATSARASSAPAQCVEDCERDGGDARSLRPVRRQFEFIQIGDVRCEVRYRRISVENLGRGCTRPANERPPE